MMRFKHFFWDFDGTLFNTYPRVTRAMLKALRDHGIEADYEEVFKTNKVSLEATALLYAPQYGLEPSSLLDDYRKHAEEEDDSTMRLFDGAREFLETVVQNGGDNFLYSHRGLSGVEALKRNGILPLFRDCVTHEDGFPSKPAPDALNYLCAKYALDKKECVMLGDRTIDLDAGINAGMSCALLDPDGLCPSDVPTPFRAHSFAEMRTLLQL